MLLSYCIKFSILIGLQLAVYGFVQAVGGWLEKGEANTLLNGHFLGEMLLLVYNGQPTLTYCLERTKKRQFTKTH
jgi:hypothetical protein